MTHAIQRMHPAEARLARYLQVGRLKNDSGPIELQPISCKTVGMDSPEDLQLVFDQLDDAIRHGQTKKVAELMNRLEPKKE